MTTMSLIPWLSSSGWLLGTFCFPGSLKIYKIVNKNILGGEGDKWKGGGERETGERIGVGSYVKNYYTYHLTSCA